MLDLVWKLTSNQLLRAGFQQIWFYCFQQSPIHPYQLVQIHRYQGSRIQHHQLVPSEATFTPTSEARSTTNSLLPIKPFSALLAKPDLLLPACSRRSRIHCNQWSQIIKEVRVCMSEQWDQPCQSCRSKARSKASCQLILNPDSLLQACSQWSHIIRDESEHVREVRQSISEFSNWMCQSCVSKQISCKSEHVRVVGASLSELWEWAC